LRQTKQIKVVPRAEARKINKNNMVRLRLDTKKCYAIIMLFRKVSSPLWQLCARSGILLAGVIVFGRTSSFALLPPKT